MAAVTKFIRGYVTDTREYAANTRIDIHAPNSVCRVYASSRGNIKDYQSSHKYSQIRGLDIRRYADIRGHSHRFTVTYPRMDLVTSALTWGVGDVGPGSGTAVTDGPERLFWRKQKLPRRPQRSGCSPRPKPPFARVGRARASVSVPVRVPYSPPRRSGRGGTPIPVDV